MHDGLLTKVQEEGDPNFDPRMPYVKKDTVQQMQNLAQQFKYSSCDEMFGILDVLEENIQDIKKYMEEYQIADANFANGSIDKKDLSKSKESVLANISKMQYLAQKLTGMSAYL